MNNSDWFVAIKYVILCHILFYMRLNGSYKIIYPKIKRNDSSDFDWSTPRLVAVVISRIPYVTVLVQSNNITPRITTVITAI